MKYLRLAKNYFVEAYHELKKVQWPTRRHTLNLTAAVVAITAVTAAIISLYDLGLKEALKATIKKGEAASTPVPEGIPATQEIPFDLPIEGEQP